MDINNFNVYLECKELIKSMLSSSVEFSLTKVIGYYKIRCSNTYDNEHKSWYMCIDHIGRGKNTTVISMNSDNISPEKLSIDFTNNVGSSYNFQEDVFEFDKNTNTDIGNWLHTYEVKDIEIDEENYDEWYFQQSTVHKFVPQKEVYYMIKEDMNTFVKDCGITYFTVVPNMNNIDNFMIFSNAISEYHKIYKELIDEKITEKASFVQKGD